MLAISILMVMFTVGAAQAKPVVSTQEIDVEMENALINETTQADFITLVIFGFTIALIVGVLGFVLGAFRGKR